jgi:hypothetical protein
MMFAGGGRRIGGAIAALKMSSDPTIRDIAPLDLDAIRTSAKLAANPRRDQTTPTNGYPQGDRRPAGLIHANTALVGNKEVRYQHAISALLTY